MPGPGYESEIYTPDALKIEFFDSLGPVSVAGFVDFVEFSNQEVLLVENFFGIETKVTQNAQGDAISQAVLKPRKWALGAINREPITSAKIHALQICVREGYRLRATVKNYLIYDPLTEGMIVTTSTAERGAIMDPCVLSIADQSYEVVKRARGMERFVSFPFELLSSFRPDAPANPNPGGIVIIRNPSGSLSVSSGLATTKT